MKVKEERNKEIHLKVKHGGSNVIASNGVKSEGNFTIQANAHAFRILSSGLYSDKISAVLREVGCNAADSHIAAGCPTKPIEVKLPSSLSKEFYIKDYGVGLSHEEVVNLFTSYFSSNKGDTNDMTGAFGLGSKSPFSYTGSFSLTAVKDGVKRSYTAHIGANGAPVIALLAEDTASKDWMSGVMVSFPVKESDIREFHEKAKTVFSRFSVKPTILGGEAISDLGVALKGKRFYFLDDQAVPASVIMGNVAYPINEDRLDVPQSPLGSLLGRIINGKIQIIVPIGSVMPTASREELEYDPQTRANVLEYLKASLKELGELLIAKEREAYPTEWQKRKALHEYASRLPATIRYHEGIEAVLALAGASVAEQKRLAIAYCEFRVKLETWVGNWTKQSTALPATSSGQPSANSSPVDRLACDVFMAAEYQRSRGTRIERRKVTGGRIIRGQNDEPVYLPLDKVVEVIYDDSTHFYPRVRKYIEDGHADIVLMVDGSSKETEDKAVLEYARRLAQSVGGIEVKASSSLELPDIPKAIRVKGLSRSNRLAQLYAAEEVELYEFDDKRSHSQGVKTAFANVPANIRYYEIERKRRYGSSFEIELGAGRTTRVSTTNLIRAVVSYRKMAEAGLPLKDIPGFIAVSSKQVKKLKLNENGWKPLLDTLIEQVSSKPFMDALRSKLSKLPKFDSYEWNNRGAGVLGALVSLSYTHKETWNYLYGKLDEFPVFKELYDRIMTTNAAESAASSVNTLFDVFLKYIPLNLKNKPEQMDKSALNELMVKAYPLLKCADANRFYNLAAEDKVLGYAAMKQLLLTPSEVEALYPKKGKPAKLAVVA